MDTSTLRRILREEMQGYAGKGLNAISFLTIDAAEQMFAVIDLATIRGKQIVGMVLAARVDGDQIYIECDQNDKPLADALRARGVPAEQIIPRYLDTWAVS